MPTPSPSRRAPARPTCDPARSSPAGPPAGASARAESFRPRTGRWGALAFSSLAAGLAAFGCHRAAAPVAPPRPRPVLAEVDVQVSVPPDDASPPHFDGALLQERLRARLLATGLFSASGNDGGEAPRARATARIGAEAVEVGAKGEARVHVDLRVDDGRAEAADSVSFALEGRGSERYAATPARKAAPPTPSPRDAVTAELVLRVAGDLIDGYLARRQIAQGPPAAVHAALEADGGELRDEAIRAVGERKLRDEAPRLLQLLNDPDERTRDEALGALIALGDRRAVTELTRTRSLRDRREMRKIIEAIAILGGREADDYLSFVAATHDDDEIRAEAAAARARLERRENDATALGSR